MGKHFFVLLFIFLFTYSASGEMGPSSYIDNSEFKNYITPHLMNLQEHSDELYDLDDVMDSDAYKKAKKEAEREEIMRLGFLAKRDRLILEYDEVRVTTIAVTNALGLVAAAVGWYFFGPALGGAAVVEAGAAATGAAATGAAATGAAATGAGTSASIAGMLGSSIKGLVAWSTMGSVAQIFNDARAHMRLRYHGLEGITLPMQKTQEFYAKKYPKLKKRPELLRAVIDKLRQMSYDTVSAGLIYDGFVRIAAQVPASKKGTYFDAKLFSRLFSQFPPEIYKKLENLAKNHVLVNRMNLEPKLSFPFYFQGVHGSGKTYAAKSLAKALGVPLGTLVLEGARIQDIIGVAPIGHNPGDPGRLLTALTTTLMDPETRESYEDGILFIDEFDRLLNAQDPEARAILTFMLKALDPNNRSFYSEYLGVNIKLPKTIILAGNFDIKDAALADRFQILVFPGFDRERRINITREVLVPEICKTYNMTPLELKPTDWKAIEMIASNSDKWTGMRDVEKAVLSHIASLAFEKFNKEIETAATISK